MDAKASGDLDLGHAGGIGAVPWTGTVGVAVDGRAVWRRPGSAGTTAPAATGARVAGGRPGGPLGTGPTAPPLYGGAPAAARQLQMLRRAEMRRSKAH